MDDLVAFVKARLDKSEQSAKAMTHAIGDIRSLWSPAQLLAGIEAKRRILALHAQGHECPALVTDPYPHVTDYYHSDCPTIIAMASEWSAHQDYRQEWKP
jgi:hypothetical protein